VVADPRSARLSPDEVFRLARERPERVEVFIEWETDDSQHGGA
jgi:hypothetical protein